MTLPNFLICGIQKGGTTALYEYLRAHPDVFMPERKELCFFDQNWDAGLEWYAAHFAQAGEAHTSEAQAIGEASPHYMRFEQVAHRIRATLEKPKLLFILRDPTDRAFSNYNYNLGRGQQDPRVSFEAALASSDGAERYLDKGFYLRDLLRFEALFGRESMQVLFAEDLRSNVAGTLERTFRFLGVDPARWTPTTLDSNTTRVPEAGLARTALFRWGQLRRHLVPWVPAGLAARTRGMRSRALRSLPPTKARPSLDPETRARLDHTYAQANQELASWLLKGDEPSLPAWLTAAARATA